MAMVTVVLVAVMATALTAGIVCDGDVCSGAHSDGDCVCGAGGVKEAIQDLYAEIVGGGDPPDTRLDDVASAKARFVSDSLRRMIDNCETATTTTTAAQVTLAEGGGGVVDDTVVERKLRSQQKAVIDALKRYDETHGADVGERTAKHVDWLMDKCVEIALAKRAAAAKSAGVPRVDMDALHKRCNELLDQFERSRTPATTVHYRGVFGHKSRTSPKARSPTPTTRPPPPPTTPTPTPTPTPTTRPPSTVRPPPTTKPTRPPRRPSPRSMGRFGLLQLSERPRVAVVDR